MPGQQAKQWILADPPTTDAILEGENATFKLETVTLPEVGTDEILVKVRYLSNDPAQRGWIQKDVDPERLYVPPVYTGEVMRAFGVGEVVESRADSLKKGTFVVGTLNWTDYSVVRAKEFRPIITDEESGIRPTTYLGALGFPGLTSYYGIVDIAGARPEDTVVISGAAGATGSVVVQIAKHLIGCKKVIGIAGGEKKCKWVESIGADICIDYKSASFKKDLLKATEGFVELYFDNVGGEILDLMLTRIKRFGRVAACGSIATYNNPGDAGLKNWFGVINRIQIKGFIVGDAMNLGQEGPMLVDLTQSRAGSILESLTQGIKDGKIKVDSKSETIVPTNFEDIPKTWTTLFTGANQGS